MEQAATETALQPIIQVHQGWAQTALQREMVELMRQMVAGLDMQGEKEVSIKAGYIVADENVTTDNVTHGSQQKVPKQKKVLDAAIKNEIEVGAATILLTLIRNFDSKGLQFILTIESDYGLQEEDVRSSRQFPIDFPINETGDLLPGLVEVVVTAPDFSPPSQSKTIKVYPNDDELEPIEFMLTPLISGNLQLIIEVYQVLTDSRQKIGSKPMKTVSKDNPSPYAKYRVMTLMFGTHSVSNQSGQTIIYGDVVHGDKTDGDKITVGNINDAHGVAIGKGSTAVDERGVHVGRDVGGYIITGDHNQIIFQWGERSAIQSGEADYLKKLIGR
ncbi:MAG: hypothetical protein GY805_08430, partial [Chloroflexi bacterium]|nr:hypothetical protein [Chloroflexota bacterium]